MSNELRLPAMKASAVFQLVFLLATVVALFATFFAISGIGPISQAGSQIIWLLSLNALLILALGIMLTRRYRKLNAESSAAGRGRLTRRFVAVSSLAAMVPALLMALFLGLTVARGLDYWFSDRVRTTVEETAEIARDNVDAVVSGLENAVRDLASDLNQDGAVTALSEDPGLYRSYLQNQAVLRDLDAINIVDSSGRVLASTGSDPAGVVIPVAEDFDDARAGNVAIRLVETSGMARALFRLEAYPDAFVYTRVDSFSPETLDRLRRAEAAVVDYRETLQRSDRIGLIFAIGYFEIAALGLLLSVRLGLEAAASVTQPVGRLAAAAMAVREGDLDTRVPVSTGDDEMTTLTLTFNDMTQQLQAQRTEIEAARQDAEDRRAFLAALLSDVNAGVIRTDEAMNITIANSAALSLLEIEQDVEGAPLGDIVPEFLFSAQRSLKEQASFDVSLDVRRGGASRNFRLKTSPDRTGGCVLTFDDTTRLVTAQRQMAWRDVARRIAHEIRNPLTPIQLSAERLKRRYRDLAGPDDQTFEKCTDTILRQVADIGRMVEEFSSFARMPKPTVDVFDVSKLLEHVAYSQRMVTPDIEVVIENTGEPINIHGDERLLGQAFTNIIKNASEALQRRPETDDFDGQIAVSIERSELGILIAVEDNGPGFPQEDREKLIEPYVTQREGGTGLGLAIVSRIVMDHGGSLALMNRADGRRGARVQIILPIDMSGTVLAEPDSVASSEERV